MHGLKKINLQLFAEGDTIPNDTEGVNLDNKPEEKQEKPAIKNPFERLIRNGFTKPEKKELEKKDDKKSAAELGDKGKKTEPSKELDTKEPEKEEEFIPIKHLGKEVKIAAKDRDKYLQMGYDYSHVKGEAETAKATLKKIARAEGFNTVDEYLAELSKREKAVLAEKIEEAVGDPDKIDEIVKNHPIVKQTQEERQMMEAEKAARKREETIDELKKDKFFSDLEPQFNELAEANPTVAPDLLYKIVRSDYLTADKINELITKEKASAEKKVMADVHDKERRAAPTGGDTNDSDAELVRPTSTVSEISKAFGVSANKVAQRIALKNKNKK